MLLVLVEREWLRLHLTTLQLHQVLLQSPRLLRIVVQPLLPLDVLVPDLVKELVVIEGAAGLLLLLRRVIFLFFVFEGILIFDLVFDFIFVIVVSLRAFYGCLIFDFHHLAIVIVELVTTNLQLISGSTSGNFNIMRDPRHLILIHPNLRLILRQIAYMRRILRLLPRIVHRLLVDPAACG